MYYYYYCKIFIIKKLSRKDCTAEYLEPKAKIVVFTDDLTHCIICEADSTMLKKYLLTLSRSLIIRNKKDASIYVIWKFASII